MSKMEFCYVPAGPFLMGSIDEDEMAFDDEKPLHQVDLLYDYWLARFPVTVAQFTTFVQHSDYQLRDGNALLGWRIVRWCIPPGTMPWLSVVG
jgi:formylglycine-generating enzyme required for sulfatase activity